VVKPPRQSAPDVVEFAPPEETLEQYGKRPSKET
jgi:hypothetical protein